MTIHSHQVLLNHSLITTFVGLFMSVIWLFVCFSLNDQVSRKIVIFEKNNGDLFLSAVI